MLENITQKQQIFLWVITILLGISIFIDIDYAMPFGILFILCVVAIEGWNNAGEKQQLKKRVKELETQIHGLSNPESNGGKNE